jgi:hypothetical protein
MASMIVCSCGCGRVLQPGDVIAWRCTGCGAISRTIHGFPDTMPVPAVETHWVMPARCPGCQAAR